MPPLNGLLFALFDPPRIPLPSLQFPHTLLLSTAATHRTKQHMSDHEITTVRHVWAPLQPPSITRELLMFGRSVAKHQWNYCTRLCPFCVTIMYFLTRWEEKRWRGCMYPQSQQPAASRKINKRIISHPVIYALPAASSPFQPERLRLWPDTT